MQTDAKNLKHLFNTTSHKSATNQMHCQWMLSLSEWDFNDMLICYVDVMHMRDTDDKMADFSSCQVSKKQLKDFREVIRCFSDYKENEWYKFKNETKKKTV